jgi:hypothetical protein
MIPYSDPCDDVIDDSEPQPAAVVFRLCNFVTGEPDLLPRHMQELRSKILDTSWPHSTGYIDIVGYSSRLQYAHDPEGNDKLSLARCERVKSFIGSALPHGFRLNVTYGAGDLPAQGASLNAGYFRAVLVRLFAQHFSKPPYTKIPQPILRPQQSASNLFMFEAISIHSASIAFAQSDELLFKLTDMTNFESRYFIYGRHGLALGATISWPPVSKSSGTDSSERPQISTSFALRDLADFESPMAELSQIGAGVSMGSGLSWGKLRLEFKPHGFLRRGTFHSVVVVFSFSKGVALGGGVSGTKGSVQIMPVGWVPSPTP